MRYSYDTLVYYGEAVADSFARLARFGYDGIELIGEPDRYNVDEIRELKKKYKLEVSSICSIFFGEERDLVAAEADNRSKAQDYVRRVVDFAADVGCPMVIVRPAPFGKTAATSSKEDEWGWAVEGIGTAADHAAQKGVRLCIEAWNRYETYFGNTIEQVLSLCRAVNRPNVGVMGDTFHMALEEVSIPDALRRAGSQLFHVHFADSNRAAPGAGHTDFEPIIETLNEIGYQGYVAFELLPAAADVFGTIREGGGREFFDPYTRQALDVCKAIERRVSSVAAR
jgi:sugar phosphate isomerase/epimerase